MPGIDNGEMRCVAKYCQRRILVYYNYPVRLLRLRRYGLEILPLVHQHLAQGI